MPWRSVRAPAAPPGFRVPTADDLFGPPDGFLGDRVDRVHFCRVEEIDTGHTGLLHLGMTLGFGVPVPPGHGAQTNARHLRPRCPKSDTIHRIPHPCRLPTFAFAQSKGQGWTTSHGTDFPRRSYGLD